MGVVIVTLLQVTIAGVVLIALPMRWIGRNRDAPATPGRFWTVLHFAAIGCGFMMIEMLFIQQLTRFLGAPIYAVAVVPAGLSGVARRDELIPLAWAVNGVASVSAAPLAILLAVTTSFVTVVGVCIFCYLLVFFFARR